MQVQFIRYQLYLNYFVKMKSRLREKQNDGGRQKDREANLKYLSQWVAATELVPVAFQFAFPSRYLLFFFPGFLPKSVISNTCQGQCPHLFWLPICSFPEQCFLNTFVDFRKAGQACFNICSTELHCSLLTLFTYYLF